MDDLDRVLSSERMVAPSPRFAVSVMQAIRREAEAPPALAFPWRRAAAGAITVSLLILGALLALPFLPAPASFGDGAIPSNLTTKVPAVLVGQVTFALLAAFLSVRLSFRLAGHRT
jgi:hypothetical protein